MTFITGSNVRACAFNRHKSRAVRRNQALRLAFMEQLEARTLLSTVDFGSGTLIYNDGGAAANVTISLASSTVEQITDPNVTISLTPTAIILGWTATNAHTVIGPTSSFSLIDATGSTTAGFSLTVNYANGDPLSAGGLVFTPTTAAPGSTNHFTLQGGSFTSETYNGLASNVANITYADSAHSNAVMTLIGINFVTDTTPVSSFTVNTPSPATTVNIASGVIGGSVIYQIGDGGAGTFPFINFDSKTIATLNANNANTTITSSPTAAALALSTFNINATAGNDTINIQNTSSGVFTGVDTGNATNSTINIGNVGNTLAGIAGAIDIRSHGTVNINDNSDITHANATLDNASGNIFFPLEVKGLSTGTIAYTSGLSALNIKSGTNGGSGVTFNINNTPTGTTTTLTGGANQNSYNLSSGSEVNGLDNLTGAIVIHGGPGLGDIVTVNDSDASSSNNYTVTATTVSRANFGGLTYNNINSLILDTQNTQSGSNTVTINGTANNVNTTINSFGSGDTVTLNSTGSFGTVALNTQTAGSTINIVACSSPVSVNMNASGFVNIGSTGGNGILTGIQAAVSLINGPSFFDFNLHDENDSTAQTWTLNNNDGGNTANIGLSSGSVISYRPGDLNVLNVNGGSGGNTFNVNTTSGQFTTTLNTGTGNDATHVFSTGAGTLNINGQDNVDTITFGGLPSIGMQNLAGTINMNNPVSFNDIILDDSQDTTARAIALSDDGTNENITGISPASIHCLDSDTGSLTLNGGTGGNNITVSSSSADFPTTLNTGSGIDTVNVIATSGNTLNINGQGGADIVNLGANGTLQPLAGTINITNAGGATALDMDNSNDTTLHTTTVTDSSGFTTVSGLSPATFAYADSGIASVALSTGQTADTITVNSTGADATLNITTTGTVDGNTVNIIACSSPINITSNAGTTVNVGSNGGNGTMAGIQGAVFAHNPLSFTTLNVHDENDTTARTWTLDDNSGTENIALSGSAAVSCINFDINALTVNSGSGVNTFNVNQTSEFGSTTINTNNAFGTDIINVFATGNNTLDITGQQGFSAVNLGGLAGIGMQNLNGTINVTNPNAQTSLSVDDSQDTTGRTTSISGDGTTNTITGLSPATINYAIDDVRTVNLTTGSGNDSTTVNFNFVDLFLNDAGGNNTLTIDSQTTKPTITAGANSHQIIFSAIESNGFPIVHPINIQGYSNVSITDLPITITQGSAQTVTSVVHSGFINSTVADFNVNFPLIGSSATGLPIGDFTSGIAWGDGTSPSAGAIIQDPNNPDHYFINSSHTFSAIGAFTVNASAVFTPPGGVNSFSTALNGVTISLPLSATSKTANVTALSTTPNTSVFSPAPAAIAAAGKLLKKFVIQLKTPANKLDATDNSAVTVSIASGPGNFANGSITTINAVKGKATFSHLELNTAGTYTLTISNGEKTITSQSFTVTASTVASLTISSPPVSPNNTTALSFTVHAFDAFGNAVAKAPVKLAIATGPAKSKIVGTVSENTAANGTAIFSNLFLHTGGAYTLKATSKSAFIITSSFTIGVV